MFLTLKLILNHLKPKCWHMDICSLDCELLEARQLGSFLCMVMRQHKGCFNPYSTSQTHFSYLVTCHHCHLPGFGMQYKLSSVSHWEDVLRLICRELYILVIVTCDCSQHPLSMSREDMYA